MHPLAMLIGLAAGIVTAGKISQILEDNEKVANFVPSGQNPPVPETPKVTESANDQGNNPIVDGGATGVPDDQTV